MNSLFVATPMYGGQCYGAYAYSMAQLSALCAKNGTKMRYFQVANESRIDRARNICAEEFLKSGMTHLMFIDGDIEFDADSVLDLLNAGKDVICGFYPKKHIAWEKIRDAVKLGLADKDPNVLDQFVGAMVFTPAYTADPNAEHSLYEPIEVHEAGTGFMLIRREVFDRIAGLHYELSYRKGVTTSETMTCFFNGKIDEYTELFLSEDYDFCRLVRGVGMKIWLAPWAKLNHHGYYRFTGNVEALGVLGNAKMKAA